MMIMIGKIIYLVLGTVIIVLGLIIGHLLPQLIEQIIDKQIALTPGSQSYPMWKESPVPIYQKFYFYNVTNPQDIELGDRPQLEEIGPFTYRSEWRNEDIELSDDERTLDFRHIKQWHFEPNLSIADHRLQVVTINAPLAITMSLIQSAPNAVRYVVTFSLDGFSEGFFVKRSIKQLLFDGYPDLLTSVGPFLNSEMLSQGGQFAYFNSKNNSEDGHYEINTGASGEIDKLNTINKFNGRTQIPYWSTSNQGHCTSLEGATTGEMFPPLAENQSEIRLFQPDFCRVWPLNYESTYEHPSGLTLRRFRANRDIFRNSSDLPENSCFFQAPNQISISNRLKLQHQQQSSATTSTTTSGMNSRNNRQSHNVNNRIQPGTNGNNNLHNQNHRSDQSNRQQQQQQSHQGSNRGAKVRHEWPNGVFTLAPCKFNAPIYLSMPHFLEADSFFQDQVLGLSPDPSKHDFFMDVEPRTGAPVVASARVQINLAISRPPGLIRFRNIPEIMFPIFWQELSVNLSGQVLDNLLLASKQAQENTQLVAKSFMIMGSAILITSLLFLLSSYLTSSTTSLFTSQASSPSSK